MCETQDVPVKPMPQNMKAESVSFCEKRQKLQLSDPPSQHLPETGETDQDFILGTLNSTLKAGSTKIPLWMWQGS